MAKIQLKYPEHTLCSHEMTVAVEDMNPSGHLGFDRLASYLIIALDRFLEPYGIIHRPGEPREFIVADLAVDYQGEAFAGDRLSVDMGVGEKYSKGVEVYFRIRTASDGKPVALAKIGIVFFDYAVHRSVPVPCLLKKAVEKV